MLRYASIRRSLKINLVIFIYGHIGEIDENDESLPAWAKYTGVALAAVAVLQIPIWAIYVIYRNTGYTIKEKILNGFKPTKDWGPSDPVDRAGWIELKKSNTDGSTNKGNVVMISSIFNRSFEENVL